MNLAAELTLLAYTDEGTPVTDGMHLDNGLGGALLLELTLAGRLDVADKRVVVLDPAATGDRLVDDALLRIARDDRPRKPGYWVRQLAKDTRPRVLDQLVTDGVLTRTRDRVLGLFPRTKFPSADGVEPPAETDARQRIRAAVLGSEPVDARTGALCALVAATELDQKLFDDLPRRQVKTRLREIGEGSWAAAAVKKTIDEVQAAILAAIIASTTAAAGSSS